MIGRRGVLPGPIRVLLHVLRKEFLQLRQDKRMIPILLFAPVLQLIGLGYAANLDVTNIPLLLVDQDRSEASRTLVERFTASGYFRLVGSVDEPEQADRWLVRGKAQMALVIHSGYGEALASGRSGEVQVLADGSEANSAGMALGYAGSVIAGALGTSAAGVAVHAATGIASRPDAGVASVAAGIASGAAARVAAGTIKLEPRIWYNPDLRSRWFFVPAILAMVLMMTTMILPSMAVVREREIGTLEQLIVTPIRSWQLIVGKLLPFAIVGILDLVLVTVIAVTLFGVPLRGSFFLLLLLSALFLLTTLGLGLLASTLVRNQQQAMMTSIFLLMVPMIYLSGLLFPIENMPKVIQYGTYAIPLRYYNIIIRGIFLRGAGLSVLWPEALVLAGYGVAIITLASMRFRKRLD